MVLLTEQMQQQGADSQTLPAIAILMCTYNGQRHLVDQLESFAAQTHSHWKVWASDDGSKDDTYVILEKYRAQWGTDRLAIHFGPGKGFAANFLSLICRASIQADYYAYSDQDDIWEADKLERAINWLQSIPQNTPALYCSRTRLVDANNNAIGFSHLFTSPPCFANALVQSISGGNTMVFNNAARALLYKAGENIQIVTHDWWTYLVVSGCGGRVFYDRYPSLRYRQHDGNLSGTNTTWSARFLRMRKLWQGHFKQWNDAHIQALNCLRDQLIPENLAVLDQFIEARKQSLILRLIRLKHLGIYRQTFLGNLGLVAAAIFKKL